MNGCFRVLCVTGLFLGACNATPLRAPPDSGVDHPAVAVADASSDLPADSSAGCLETTNLSMGIQLDFVHWPCRFTQRQLQAGVTFPYRLTVSQPLAGVHPTTSGAGGCAEPDESGLIVTYRISGGAQNYCLCDTGLCAPVTFTTNPPAGTYERSFAWSGENWSGPSDYGQPKGAPFPPGTYTVSVNATGTVDVDGGAPAPFDVSAQTLITITP